MRIGYLFKRNERLPCEVEKANFAAYEAREEKPYPEETAFLGDKPHVATPNDALAHCGLSAVRFGPCGQGASSEEYLKLDVALARDPWY